MAIDKVTGKRIQRVKTILDIKEEKKQKALPKFDTTYEEELIKQLFEEDLKKKEKKKESLELVESITQENKVHKERPGEEWDVPIDEEIQYFDPELSYEISGYRPITMEKGLDFDPEPFREMARIYEETGKYTEFPEGSKPWRDLGNREVERWKNGLTIGKYRITGDNYYYLNYYRMQIINEGSGKAGEGRIESFPKFLAKQYEWFHYFEIAERIGKDAGALKARGVGWSEMTAAMAVRPYSVIPKYNVLLTAAAEDQLRPLLDKCWFQLDWLNTNTQGIFRHVRQKVNNATTKRASKVLRDGTETGFQSQIDSIIADEAKKIRGYRQDRLVFEECFGKGTKVIMADYSRKNIEDIKVGDFVMGINGTPQEVINTCSGVDSLFLVKQNKGTDYIVNSNHKLYTEFRPRVGNMPDRIELLTAPEYLNLSDYYKRTHYALKSAGLYRTENHLEIDPWFFGAWLGDGYSDTSAIIINETDDPEIKESVWKYYNSLCDDNIYIKVRKNNSHSVKTLNDYYLSSRNLKGSPIRQWLRRNNLLNNKHIPDYIYDLSMEDRLQILAGLIDTDGNLKKGNASYSFTYEISMARKNLILQIMELARSCGFFVSYSERIMKQGYKINSEAFRVVIHGNLRRIPVRVARKKLPEDYIETSNKLSGAFRIEKSGYGEYYGFTLKSYDNPETDHLFLLDDYTIVHNCGNNKNLAKSWVQGAALTQLGGIHFGTRLFLGTSGEEVDMEGLARMFQNPEAFDVLPYKNYDTYDGKPELTAFFLPAHKFALSSKYLDNRGVTNHIEFKKYYEAQRAKLTGKDYLNECAEHCFIPEEALAKTGANVFDSELISQQMVNLKIHNLGEKIIPTQLEWDKNAPQYSKVNSYEFKDSKLLIVEPPQRDPEGNVWKNLYVAGVDAVDVGTDNSATDGNVSDFCIMILRRTFGVQEPKIVAIYKDRPRDIRIAYMIALKLLTWYNAPCMLEFTKISFQQFLRDRGKENFLMSRPDYAISSKNKKKTNKRLIGVPSTESVIKHGLELIQMFLSDYYYSIDFPDLLTELLKYTYENKRKFDMVAALQMTLIGDEALTGITPIKQQQFSKEWKDFGWYINEKGYRQFGVIPKRQTQYDTTWTRSTGYY